MESNTTLIRQATVHQPDDVEKNGQQQSEHLILRCANRTCRKMLGKVDANMVVHIESSRKGWWIKVELAEGNIICKKCGNKLHWKREQLLA